MEVKKIAIGCDHAGFVYKDALVRLLEAKGLEVVDCGTSGNNSVDYPDFAHPVSEIVKKESGCLGILLCGSGNGVAMAANKHQSIRAALCWTDEIARFARTHNDANVLCIPARYVSDQLAEQMTQTFISTAFEGGRHSRRVDKISCC